MSLTSNFIIYHISSLYLPKIFAPNFHFSPPPLPLTEHDAPSAQVGLRIFTTASPTKRQQGKSKNNYPPDDSNLYSNHRYSRDASIIVPHRLQQSPPPPTLAIIFQASKMSGINNVFYYLLLLFSSSFFLPDINSNKWRRQGYPLRQWCSRRILPFPFRHCRHLCCCRRFRCCNCDNLVRLLQYSPSIYPPPFSADSVHT